MKKTIALCFIFAVGIAINAQCQTVYASQNGEKYHTADCKLSGDAKAMTLAAAKKMNKNPCSICKPEEHFKDKVVQCEGKTGDGTRCKRMTADKAKKCFQHRTETKK